MKLSLFGPDLYTLYRDTTSVLTADMRMLPELMNTWTALTAPDFFLHSPVGKYDKPMNGLVFGECVAWSRKLNHFPDLPVPIDAPSRMGLIPRSNILFRAMTDAFSVPDTEFWRAVCEVAYGYSWYLLDNIILCQQCVQGSSCMAMLACFPDYFHFQGDLHTVLEACSQLLDAWFMTVQSVYLNVLHPKAHSLNFPDNELRGIKYRLIDGGGRPLASLAQLEQRPLVGGAKEVNAVAFASTMMHDICDCRHDNHAKDRRLSTNPVHRLCIDVWAWAIDHGAQWAIHHGGQELAWQLYMARYHTAILLDHILPPTSQDTYDPYGDDALNTLNPLPRSSDPLNFDLRSRCQDPTRYDSLLSGCLEHFNNCSNCRGYDRTKYTDCTCLNVIATYMILADTDKLWWLPDPTAKYTGPTGEWSPMLC
ncbi:hypothetical protein BDV25DRAFT_130025 [Aspergillus avenaceus]|uniref:Uncharacterized protein n=1 Tax=Aspergillus avenaceus TaxID=36643 RepID=A0A5N6TU20_ASPAV|nr:hypothetical protein BDV25DRAFT_130025 [Aspergillus avenaceus]